MSEEKRPAAEKRRCIFVPDLASGTGLHEGCVWLRPTGARLCVGRFEQANTASLTESASEIGIRRAAQTHPAGNSRSEPLKACVVTAAMGDARAVSLQERASALGPNPTDRGKPNTKRPILADAKGIPLALRPTGSDMRGSQIVDAVLDAVPPIRRCRGRPRKRSSICTPTKSCDHRYRQALTRRGIQHRIARYGIESRQRLGRHGWVVERTLAWFAQFRRLAIRCERQAIYLAVSTLTAALIAWHLIERWLR